MTEQGGHLRAEPTDPARVHQIPGRVGELRNLQELDKGREKFYFVPRRQMRTDGRAGFDDNN